MAANGCTNHCTRDLSQMYDRVPILSRREYFEIGDERAVRGSRDLEGREPGLVRAQKNVE